MKVTKKIKALCDFELRTTEQIKLFVEDEVAEVTFKNEQQFLNLLKQGNFEEAEEDALIGKKIPVIPPPIQDESTPETVPVGSDNYVFETNMVEHGEDNDLASTTTSPGDLKGNLEQLGLQDIDEERPEK